MTLKGARTELDELDKFAHNFLLLNPLLQYRDDPTMINTDETQNSLRLMEEIRSTSLINEMRGTTANNKMRSTSEVKNQICFPLMDKIRSTNLYTTSTTGTGKKLTQRNTKLCVSMTASRLLSYGLVDFLEPYCKENPTSFMLLKNSILNISNDFIEELITICCSVISPRSLTGLNHCKLDDNFLIAAQEQNIRE